MPFPKKTTPVEAAATNRHRRHPLRRQDEDDVQQQQAQPFILLPCDEEPRGLLDVLMANPTCAAASQDGQIGLSSWHAGHSQHMWFQFGTWEGP